MLSTFSTAVASALPSSPSPVAARVLGDMGPMVGQPMDSLLPPVILLVLCIAAGIATWLMLPSRREATLAKVGGVLAIAVFLVFVALIIHKVGGTVSEGGSGVYFWIFAAIAVVSAMRVITHPRPVYSALYFVLTVCASAGLFILMWAEFMAVALIIIYAGAILITYVFVIMLAQQSTTDAKPLAGFADYDITSREPLVAAAVGFVLMGVLLFVIFDKAVVLPAAAIGSSAPNIDSAYNGATQILGRYLFEHQLVNLELAGLLLTVSMVGAIVIARRRVVAGEIVETPEIEEISAQLTPVSDAPSSVPVFGTTNPRAKAYPEA